jgi:CRP/FNR family transcriptional regulator, cyclic AMP receptor protein
MITKEFLTKIPIFKLLPEEDYLSLVSLWKKRELKKGDILFKKGDPGNSMYVIEHGVIEIVLPVDPPLNEMLISTLNEGEFFGELSLFVDTPRTATARALEHCILIEMSHKDFHTYLLERPAIGVSMLGEMAKRLQSTNDLITSLASKNPNKEFEENLSFGDRISDKIAEFGGSWGFILSFGAFMVLWITLNVIQFTFQPFDPYPFIFLNLMLSTVAALQAPVIMMSQNRAQTKDRLKVDLDYQVNLKSELMLQQLHQKIDQLQEDQLPSLVSEMKEQITELQIRVGTLENPK